MAGAAINGEPMGRRSGTPVPSPSTLPLPRKYLIFGVLAFGQFMALLDIQIVAASLNDVQAGLAAGPGSSWPRGHRTMSTGGS